ncbi:MAG: hypothetical protein R2831_07495 [Chitinophagaceae bacterium]
MNSIAKKYSTLFYGIAILFLSFDFLSTTFHYYHLPLDGDLPKIATPILWYEDVIKDPFGTKAITEHIEYGGAGRYMCHISIYLYYHIIPNAIQFVVKDPIVSVFLSNAVLCACLYISFLFLMFRFISVTLQVQTWQKIIIFILSAACIQLNSGYDSIGLIDRSASYIFFYILPLQLLAYYFYVFYKYYHKAHPISLLTHITLLLLSIYLAFSGPLIQPILFIFFFMIGLSFILKNQNIKRFFFKKEVLFHALVFLGLCIYAFWVSRHNSEKNESISLVRRYVLMLWGLIVVIKHHIVIFFITAILILNTYLIRKKTNFKNQFEQLIKIFIFFSIIYLSLLPLGGYRSYRPYIIRYDTLQPITLFFIFCFIYSCILVLKHYSFKDNEKRNYYALLGIFVIAFSSIDLDIERNLNECQQQNMYTLHQTKDTVINVPRNCNLGTWDPNDLNDPYTLDMLSKLFRHWHVIKPYQTLK